MRVNIVSSSQVYDGAEVILCYPPWDGRLLFVDNLGSYDITYIVAQTTADVSKSCPDE